MDFDLWKWEEEDVPDRGKNTGNDTAARKSTRLCTGAADGFVWIEEVYIE